MKVKISTENEIQIATRLLPMNKSLMAVCGDATKINFSDKPHIFKVKIGSFHSINIGESRQLGKHGFGQLHSLL